MKKWIAIGIMLALITTGIGYLVYRERNPKYQPRSITVYIPEETENILPPPPPEGVEFVDVPSSLPPGWNILSPNKENSE